MASRMASRSKKRVSVTAVLDEEVPGECTTDAVVVGDRFE